MERRSGGRAFQRWGAERLKALVLMKDRWAEGVVGLRSIVVFRMGCTRSDSYGGAKLWRALVRSKVL